MERGLGGEDEQCKVARGGQIRFITYKNGTSVPFLYDLFSDNLLFMLLDKI